MPLSPHLLKLSIPSLSDFVIEISLKMAGYSGKFVNANYALMDKGEF